MAGKRKRSIRTEAFITIDGMETNIDTLSPQKKNEIGGLLKAAWLNALYAGKAAFYPEGQEKTGTPGSDCLQTLPQK